MFRSARSLILTLLAASTVALVGLAFTSLQGVEQVGRNEERAVRQGLVLVEQAVRLKSAISEQSSAVRGFVIAGQPELLESYALAGREFRIALALLAADGESAALSEAIGRQAERYRRHFAEAIAERRAGRSAEARALIAEQGAPLKAELDARIEALIAAQKDHLATLHQEVEAVERRVRWAVGASLLFALPLFLLLVVTVLRRMLGPLRDLEAAARQVGAGSLQSRVPVRSSDEFGRVATAFNAMAEQVAEAMERLQVANEELTSQTEELQATDEELRAAYQELQAAHVELEAQAQELRWSNTRLKQADQYKDEFLSVISHELRTPLNFIIGFGTILEDETSGPLNAPQRQQLAKILSGADRMLSLVNDLLDIARIRAGKLSVDPQPGDYHALVADVVESMRPLTAESGLALSMDVALDGEVVIDAQRMAQVLTNLISNAAKFTPAGGSITVRVFARGEHIVTEVSDTGPGISEADLPGIFMKFQQADMGLTREAGGVGLGLAICKAIVEAHAGAIEVESRVGEGSTFRYTLPLASQLAAPSA